MFQESAAATLDSAPTSSVRESSPRTATLRQGRSLPQSSPIKSKPIEPASKSKPSKQRSSADRNLLATGIQLASKLNRSGKIALIQAIEAMLEAEEDQMPEADAVLLRQKETSLRESGGRGRIESKFIPRNGKVYGPYNYLRWWLGKVYKSNYIGKV